LINPFLKKHGGFEGILPLLEDAPSHRFLQFAFEPIKRHALEAYRSALVWIPEKSLMRERYADALRSAPRVLYWLSESWDVALHVISHGLPVTSIASSPDGGHIVSGSRIKTVPLWNTTTGEQEGQLEGHMDRVMFVAFSPDGTRIASGSKDRTVRIWNSATGEQEALLGGHTDQVMSVGFSHKGDLIVSGSKDKSVQVWNTMTYEI
jgi:WD40 repeat protein